MNVSPGNSGFEAPDRRGPSGLPTPVTPPARDLRRRMTAYFDREMGPAEVTELEARIAEEARASAAFDATRRVVDALAVTHPSPDLTGNILDEIERRRRLMGSHRHARRRMMRGVAAVAGSMGLLGLVFVMMDAVLPPLANKPVGPNALGVKNNEAARPLESLLMTPAPVLADGRRGSARAPFMDLESPTDATGKLRWDINGSDATGLIAGAPVDNRLAAGVLPLDSRLWPSAGTAGLWPNPFPNASITQSPTIFLGLDELNAIDPLTLKPVTKPKPTPVPAPAPAAPATAETAAPKKK